VDRPRTAESGAQQSARGNPEGRRLRLRNHCSRDNHSTRTLLPGQVCVREVAARYAMQVFPILGPSILPSFRLAVFVLRPILSVRNFNARFLHMLRLFGPSVGHSFGGDGGEGCGCGQGRRLKLALQVESIT